MSVERTVDQLTLENKRIQRQNKLSERRMMLALPDLTKSLQDAVNNDVIDKKITAIESFAASSVAPSDISSSNIDLKITQSL